MRALVLFGCLLLAACGQNEDSPSQIAMQTWLGADFSQIEVQMLDGGKQPLRDALLDKKPVLVNVWATWCPPCLVEMPSLAELGKQGKYTVIAIATDKDAGMVKEFLKKQTWGQGVQVWFDKLGMVTREKMGAIGLPVSYLLDADLKVVMVEAGEREWMGSAMQGKMEKALGK